MFLKSYFSMKIGRGPEQPMAPHGLHTGSLIEIDSAPVLLAQANGTLMTDPPERLKVSSIGRYHMADLIVYRIYFGDDSLDWFLEIAVNQDMTILHHRLFMLLDEQFIGSREDQEFLVGDDGLIGWCQFRIDEKDVVYDRTWQEGPERVSPLDAEEKIIHLPAGGEPQLAAEMAHRLMLYQRGLDGDVMEFLYADYMTQKADGDEADVLRVYVGIDLAAADVKTY